MCTKSVLVFALVSFVLIIARSGSSAKPAQPTPATDETDDDLGKVDETHDGHDKTDFDVSAYLDKYGYKPCKKQVNSKNEGRCRYSTQSMLKDFQRRFGLPVTGKPDSKVLELMKSPRCGVSDMLRGFKPVKSE